MKNHFLTISKHFKCAKGLYEHITFHRHNAHSQLSKRKKARQNGIMNHLSDFSEFYEVEKKRSYACAVLCCAVLCCAVRV